jgi:hypothetical protein
MKPAVNTTDFGSRTKQPIPLFLRILPVRVVLLIQLVLLALLILLVLLALLILTVLLVPVVLLILAILSTVVHFCSLLSAIWDPETYYFQYELNYSQPAVDG